MTSSVDQNVLSARLSEASSLRNAGRIPEAITAYQEVLAIEPDLPDSWYNLAWLLRRRREVHRHTDRSAGPQEAFPGLAVAQE